MRTKSNFFFLLLALVVMMLLSGCGYHYKCGTTFGGGTTCTPSGGGIGGGGGGGGGGTGSTSALVYYADDNLGQINAIGLDGSSNFLPVANYTPPTFPSDFDGGMAIVNSKFLYLPIFLTGEVLEYTISHPTGALTPAVGGPFVGPSGTAVISDPAGNFLFVGDGAGAGVWAFTINQATGALSNVAGSPFSYTGPAFDRMTVDGNGKFLYGTGFGSGQIVGFSIDTNTGALTVVPGSPFSATVIQDVKAEASGKFLLGVHGSTGVNGTVIDNHIYVFAIDQVTGAISQVSGSPFVTVSAPFGLVVSPNGKFVYTFNENPSGGIDPLEGYSIDSTSGALTAISGSPFSTLLPYPKIGRFEETGVEFFGHPDFDFEVFNANTANGTMTQTITGQGVSSNFAFAVTDN